LRNKAIPVDSCKLNQKNTDKLNKIGTKIYMPLNQLDIHSSHLPVRVVSVWQIVMPEKAQMDKIHKSI
jgi:hypothetical protein